MFGLLQLKDFLHPDIISTGAQLAVVGGALAAIVLISYFKWWRRLWSEWIISTNPRKIGIMYLILAFIMFMRGGIDALMMRSQQALTSNEMLGFLSPDHFAQIFTAHGVIMIFFAAMPLMFGLWNLIVPLQIGARDVAFPRLNSISFWLTAAGAVLVNLSLVVGQFAATGWLAYPPLSGSEYSPGVGVDYYIWALQISGLGTLLSGINFLATIAAMRKGMKLMSCPMFTWTTLGASLLIIFAFPILTVTLGLLSLDRIVGMHFFTPELGGNAMMYVNLIWAWGHPEVYILILPAFGIFSEVVATFSQKKLFGYTSMVVATMLITVMSFIVWVHHFFTMGAGANVNAFFGIMTMAIAIPTGVKVFNWLFTMFRGRIIFATPMLWFMGFLTTFVLGGMTGVLLSIPGADFQLHNSLFLVAHFHNMIIGGVLFGFFAGITYWFPRIFGFTLDERLGRLSFWTWIIGFLLAFLPLYLLGLMGVTRRLDVIEPINMWHSLLFGVAAIGAAVIMLAFVIQLAQLIVSLRTRKKRVSGDNPWNSKAPEWSAEDTEEGSSTAGILLGGVSFLFGFGMIWQIWWLAALGLILALAILIKESFEPQHEIP